MSSKMDRDPPFGKMNCAPPTRVHLQTHRVRTISHMHKSSSYRSHKDGNMNIPPRIVNMNGRRRWLCVLQP